MITINRDKTVTDDVCGFCKTHLSKRDIRCPKCNCGTLNRFSCEEVVYRLGADLLAITLRGGNFSLRKGEIKSLDCAGILQDANVFNIDPMSLGYIVKNKIIAKIDNYGNIEAKNSVFSQGKSILIIYPLYYPNYDCQVEFTVE